MNSLKRLFNKIWAKDMMVCYYPDVELTVIEWLKKRAKHLHDKELWACPIKVQDVMDRLLEEFEDENTKKAFTT